jgi:hypothetical protein
MNPYQFGCGYFEKISHQKNFRVADPDNAGVSGTTGTAATTFKTNSVIEKIPGTIFIVWVAFHMGFNL